MGQKNDVTVAVLCPLLGDEDELVAAAAARALPTLVGTRGLECATSASLRFLQGVPPWNRRAAVMTLGDLASKGDALVLKALVALLKGETDWSVRAAVARVLPMLAVRGDGVAYNCLMGLMQDLNP